MCLFLFSFSIKIKSQQYWEIANLLPHFNSTTHFTIFISSYFIEQIFKHERNKTRKIYPINVIKCYRDDNQALHLAFSWAKVKRYVITGKYKRKKQKYEANTIISTHSLPQLFRRHLLQSLFILLLPHLPCP